MDPARHPLDWQAHGAYEGVMRKTTWKLAKARREARKAFKGYGGNPINHKRYENPRQCIMHSETLD